MKNLQTLIVSLFVASCFIFPASTSAAVPGLAFGGKISSVIPCPCSGGFAVFYTPLYMNSPVPVTGALYYSTFSSFLFSWYNPITPTVWNLGKFAPGVQECLIPAPTTGCMILPTLGSVIYEGTSGLPKGF